MNKKITEALRYRQQESDPYAKIVEEKAKVLSDITRSARPIWEPRPGLHPIALLEFLERAHGISADTSHE
jgi:hypothetical protein